MGYQEKKQLRKSWVYGWTIVCLFILLCFADCINTVYPLKIKNKQEKPIFFNPLVRKVVYILSWIRTMLNSVFCLFAFSFYKRFFLFPIFSYKFLGIWKGVRKRGVGKREDLQLKVIWGTRRKPINLFVYQRPSVLPRMEKQGQLVYICLTAGLGCTELGLAQGWWLLAARSGGQDKQCQGINHTWQ